VESYLQKQNRLLTIHFLHGPDEILRIFVTDKAKPFGLVASFVSDNSCPLERGVFVESPGEDLICYIITKVTTENSEIICNKMDQKLSAAQVVSK
jgi:hypothetical protein